MYATRQGGATAGEAGMKSDEKEEAKIKTE
jgi:hypothetical protein